MTECKARQEIIRLFQTVGRASLLADIQNSHSGNMAMLWRDEKDEETMVITSAGSQKGDLEPDQVCFLSAAETDFGYHRASSESKVHARILSLQDVRASLHCHTKELVISTLDDEDKPNQPAAFVPIDPLGHSHLGKEVPVDWFEVPSGSPEMVRTIPERLARHPLTVVQGHGSFSRGRSLKEAFFFQCVANNSGYIARLAGKIGANLEQLRRSVLESPESCFSHPPEPYAIDDDERCDFPEEEKMRREFRKAGARIFESRLSPFHTGSLSIRGSESMLYAPRASMPGEIGGPLLRLPLRLAKSDSPEVKMHKKLYAEGNFQTVLHCYVPEAEALSHFREPGEAELASRIVPIDAEGSILYPVIPVLPPKFDFSRLVRLLHDFKVVVIRGGGVWGVGAQSLSEVLHHPSSVREICLYRLGAMERRLDLKKMEPARAKKR